MENFRIPDPSETESEKKKWNGISTHIQESKTWSNVNTGKKENCLDVYKCIENGLTCRKIKCKDKWQMATLEKRVRPWPHS